jgi:hypothetical protein
MMARGGGIAGRLYRGDVSINFVRRQRTWYLISGIILLVSVVALLTRGLNHYQQAGGPPVDGADGDAAVDHHAGRGGRT